MIGLAIIGGTFALIVVGGTITALIQESAYYKRQSGSFRGITNWMLWSGIH